MSSIERLLLYGIRSFGPEDRDKAVIKFSSPLTLILGQNGCGKTTIIEALKYATCGELPGGTDGGSGFVHDPKLSGCIDIKGHVKLKCYNTKGEEVTVSRTVMVTQKSKKLEFKSIDATVTNADNKSMSGRCADIDALMNNYLGVSKAVLTNVIFCHQEDSGWPLERGKKMKERFDAIFGITEYNKCLDYMRQLAKKMDTDKVLLKKDVDYGAQTWEETQEKRKKLEETKGKLSASCDSVVSYERQLEPLQEQWNEIRRKEIDFVKHASKVGDMKSKRKFLLEGVKELKQRIQTEFVGTKEELLSKIENFQQELEDKRRKINTLNDDKNSINKDESRVQKDINTKQMLLGKLQTEDQQNQKTIENRNFNMNKLADDLKLTIISSFDINENSTAEKLKSIEQKLKEEKKDFEKFAEQKEQEEKTMQLEIDTAREEKVRIEHDKQAKARAIADNENETRKVRREIEEVDRSAETLANLERNLKEVNTKLDEVIKSLDADEHKNRIKNNIEERNKLEEKLAELDKEIKILQKYSLEKAQLDQLNERKRKREEELNNLKSKHDSSLRHLLSGVPEFDIKKRVEACLSKISKEIKSKENTIIAKEKELTILKEKKRSLEEQMRIKQRQISEDEDRVQECSNSLDFNSYLADLKDKIEKTQQAKGTLSASEVFFKNYIVKLQRDDPLCPLCRREFGDKNDVDLVITDLNKRLKEIPSNLTQTNIELDGLLDRQSRALQLMPIYENISNFRENELPKMKKEVSDMTEKINKLENDIETWQNELVEPQTDEAMAKNLLSDALSMDLAQQDVKKLQQEITVQENKLPKTGITKTLQQANDEQDEIKSKLSQIRKQLDSDQNSLSAYNEKLSRLREQKNEITAKQMKIEGGVQQRKNLTDKLEELQTMAAFLQDELTEAENNSLPVTEKLKKLTDTLRELKIQNKSKTEASRKRLNEFENKFHELKKLQTAIEEYIKKGGHNRLDKVRNELQELQLQKDKNQEQRNRIEKEMEHINAFCNTQQLKKVELEYNLQLRQKQEDIVNVDLNIAELEGQCGDLNVDTLQRQKADIKNKMDHLERQKSIVEGRQMELRNTIRDIEFELNSERFKNAEKQYKKSLVSLKVLTLAIEDLKQYEKAMDWAMIYFHKERMKMINTIVRDLWRQIYCGNDIDTIEIKTDETTPTASGRRNYNYRVVQIKNGTELDMPGRCSAGQKVLACLIIRMALAETFSKNCGILALDEPTTNLDRENIESLSIALAEIVQKRSVQKNFQLLIITHDEEFLRRLTRVDKIEYYLQVKRNNRGKSEVHKIKI